MIKIQKTPNNSEARGRKVIAAAVSLALSGSAWASDWKLGASVTARETYTDNVALSPKGSTKSDWITELTPTFTVKKVGARLKVDASYSNQNLFYANDSNRNQTYHRLNAQANAELLENEVFLDTAATISQTSISPLGASGVDNTSATGNVTSVQTFVVSPYWIHRFGSAATLNARYTISEVSNDSGIFSSSLSNSVNVSLNSGSDFGRVSWGLNYSDYIANYGDRSDVGFTSTSASLGYQVFHRVRLTGTVGDEQNSYASSAGTKTGGTFWNTTVSWAPSLRTSLDLGFGHHYYGSTRNMKFSTRGVYSQWTANYSEAVTTSNSQFGESNAVNLGTVKTTGQAAQLTTNNNYLSNQVFLSKRFSTDFNWKKGKHDFSLGAFRSVQTTNIDTTANTNTQIVALGLSGSTSDVFLSTSEVKQVGVNASWRWRWTALTSSHISANLSRSSYPSLSRQDTISSLQFGLDRRFSPKLTGAVLLRHQVRDSNQNADYTENALSGSVTYTF